MKIAMWMTVGLLSAASAGPTPTTQLKGGTVVTLPVNARTPSTFIAIGFADRFTPGALHYFAALQKAKVRSELHVFQLGGHVAQAFQPVQHSLERLCHQRLAERYQGTADEAVRWHRLSSLCSTAWKGCATKD